MKFSTEKRLTFVGFLVIPSLLFVVFFVYPIVKTISLSLYSWNGFSPDMTYVGLENYANLFGSPRFAQALFNNLRWLVFYIFLPPAIGLLLALMVDQKVRGEAIYKVIIFLPYTVTPVAVAAIWRWLYGPYTGFFNRTLTLLGFGQYAQPWLGKPEYATYAIMLATLWWVTGFAFIVFLSGLRGIPSELTEAARIDGATFSQLFLKVTFPMLLPYTIVVVALSGIEAMRIFDIIYAMTRGGPAYATEVLATQMFDVSFNRLQMGLGSSIAVVLLVVSALVILPYVIYNSRKLEGIQQ